jgi:putative N6-adenine-specific DNA methylase
MTDPTGTRGARKLEAAIAAFALQTHVAGARALDVGASTGGFTAALLAHGAAGVTAIEVGHDQLAPALRDDPRVELHERTDFRRAPLSLAPGPFDFFSVDVGFMAARNVLRSLAFRLRDCAHGVVLLKPQFELPGSQVRGGDVSDPALRARALERFGERARKLGFELLAHVDSPVAGGSGTVEMLLHLRFVARPAHLPRPGEKRAHAEPVARAATARHAPAADAFEWFAIAAPGLEAVLADELRACAHVSDVQAVAGGVTFRGGLAAGEEANLRSRVATRVLLRLGTVEAREFAVLRRRLGALPFERWLSPERTLRVQASAEHCRLYHTKALAETLLHAASDRLRAELQPHAASEADDEAADPAQPFGREAFARVLLRGKDNRFTISVDSSGLLLHRRGARVETGRAPLRESLAAGLLRLAEYRAQEPLVNAMCGAGTIAIEAAGIALDQTPGSQRGFAFEGFPRFDAGAYAELRATLVRAERNALPAPIAAFDRDARVLESARRNAERAGLAAHIAFERADLHDYTPPAASGLLIMNPPYGRRLGGGDGRTLFAPIAETLRTRWRGWRVALLVPAEVRMERYGLRGARAIALRNGGLRVKLLLAAL